MITSQLGFIVHETQVLQLFIAKYEGLMQGISLQNILADVIYFNRSILLIDTRRCESMVKHFTF